MVASDEEEGPVEGGGEGFVKRVRPESDAVCPNPFFQAVVTHVPPRDIPIFLADHKAKSTYKQGPT